MQIDSKRYSSIGIGFKITLAEGGISNLLRGWAPTFIGYSIQGAGKYGLYEYFKHLYAEMAGAKTAANYQTPLFLAASASAEFLADIGLCPMEAVKVKIQTSPGYAKGLTDGLPKFVQENGVAGLWKGLVPLWGRQIPYTMMKFAAFENIVQALYTNVVPKPKSDCSKTEQLGVSFAAGYLAGILCAVISHPADNLVSKLNASKEATIGGVINEMGWWQLATRGLPLRIAMIGTLTATQWAIYDSFKVYVGLPTTGAAPPSENEGEHAKKA
ncbi:TPA: Mitochondrial phosphate carrier protein 3, mitochondrial, variant 2 [Trebouxia sp. C0006]